MSEMPIDLAAFEAASVTREPFPYAMVPRFVRTEALAPINADYPLVAHPGSFPLPTLKYGPAFAEFMAAIQGPEFTRAVERKLGVDLKGRPTMVTARGVSAARDSYRQPHQADHRADLHEQRLGSEDRAVAAVARTGQSGRRDRGSAAR
jgi:hypothetical protein